MKSAFLVLASFVLVACSSKPSDGDIEEAIRIANAPAVAELKYYDVLSVKRLNGYEGEAGTYVVDAGVIYVTTRSYADYRAAMLKSVEQQTEADQHAVRFGLGMLRDQEGDFPKGKLKEVSQRFTMVKTEKGWRIQRP